jgi:hypothetical protein
MKFKVIATSFILLLSSGSVLAQIALCPPVVKGVTPPTYVSPPFNPRGSYNDQPIISGGDQPIYGLVNGSLCFWGEQEGTVFHRGVMAYCKLNQSFIEVPCGN